MSYSEPQAQGGLAPGRTLFRATGLWLALAVLVLMVLGGAYLYEAAKSAPPVAVGPQAAPDSSAPAASSAPKPLKALSDEQL